MKRIIAVFLILSLLAVTGCSVKEPADVSVQQVEEQKVYDDLSKYDITIGKEGVVSNYNYAHYSSVDKLWDNSDYVVIASPEIPYSESEQVWMDVFNKPTDFENADYVYSYSQRPFKVYKVFKGEDLKIKQIQVAEHIVVKEDKMRVMEICDPVQEGDKYLIFLKKSTVDDNMYFSSAYYQGIYNLNESKNQARKNIDQNMLKQVKERFKEEFK